MKFDVATIDTLRGFLRAMSALNCGMNFSTEFTIEPLAPCETLSSALDQYFSAYKVCYGGEPSPLGASEPAAAWNIEIEPLNDLASVLGRWFFELEFSPEIASGYGKKEMVVREAHTLFQQVFSDCKCYRVKTKPPLSYAIDWDDIALETSDGFWLLHLSWND